MRADADPGLGLNTALPVTAFWSPAMFAVALYSIDTISHRTELILGYRQSSFYQTGYT